MSNRFGHLLTAPRPGIRPNIGRKSRGFQAIVYMMSGVQQSCKDGFLPVNNGLQLRRFHAALRAREVNQLRLSSLKMMLQLSQGTIQLMQLVGVRVWR
ncbi:hypothetical protein EV643_1483 [Kribbella sp. VKM Ac-2527]|uniref:Uncharacterized protein n=1 Tax=Kribbella caucasensis TaxID=2512215 RepID=A0A4R6J2H3_9ACTN|nr:hypothetical protein EV643_1483 [Kribbella sp. VKM Ac-2527]